MFLVARVHGLVFCRHNIRMDSHRNDSYEALYFITIAAIDCFECGAYGEIPAGRQACDENSIGNTAECGDIRQSPSPEPSVEEVQREAIVKDILVWV